MIKLSFALTILLLTLTLSCSSTSEQAYSKNEVENRADEYSAMGDSLRNDRKYVEAANYYQMAADMYQMKGSKEKFVLTKLKQALLLLKEDKFEEFTTLMKTVELFNEVEKLKLDKQIAYLNARFYYQTKDNQKANAIILDLIKKYDSADEFEQKVYYQFYYAGQNLDLVTEQLLVELESSLEEINRLYKNGKLTNTEVLTFTNYTMSKIYLTQKKFSNAKIQIEYTETIYELLELTSKRDQIIKLYIDLYSALNNNDKKNYYLNLEKQFAGLMEKYK